MVMPKKSNKTEAWEALKESMLGKHARRFDAEMSDLNGEEFMNMYLKTLEYVAPKQQRVETKDMTDPADQVIRIEYIQSESDKDDLLKKQ
jgi:hypothetical protein